MVNEADLVLADGRTLHYYETVDESADVAIFWQHGTPNVGEPPEPLFAAAADRGMRWVSYDRPAYGGSTRRRGRDVASAAADTAAVADALGIGRFAVMGHSGGGTHALACAALLADRVLGVVCGASLAPSSGVDDAAWFAGMGAYGADQLRAARQGSEALESYLAANPWDTAQFTKADWATLSGAWGWLAAVAGKANEQGPDGLVDDNLAYVAPWGFDLAETVVPVLLIQGGRDRVVPAAHAELIAGRISSAELWSRPDDGHVSILGAADDALDWLGQRSVGD
jgi:pimeloyl-ACP methyl ester carboxylesterase